MCVCEGERGSVRVGAALFVCVRVCVVGGGGRGCVCVCVKDSAICEHVYAPLSLNLYMFE